MKKIIIALVLVFPFWASAQKGLDKLVEPDEAVRVGRLSNGMMYYIRANKIPEGRASYYHSDQFRSSFGKRQSTRFGAFLRAHGIQWD